MDSYKKRVEERRYNEMLQQIQQQIISYHESTNTKLSIIEEKLESLVQEVKGNSVDDYEGAPVFDEGPNKEDYDLEEQEIILAALGIQEVQAKGPQTHIIAPELFDEGSKKKELQVEVYEVYDIGLEVVLDVVSHLAVTGEGIVGGYDLCGGFDRLLSRVIPKTRAVVNYSTTEIDGVASAMGPWIKLVWFELHNMKIEAYVRKVNVLNFDPGGIQRSVVAVWQLQRVLLLINEVLQESDSVLINQVWEALVKTFASQRKSVFTTSSFVKEISRDTDVKGVLPAMSPEGRDQMISAIEIFQTSFLAFCLSRSLDIVKIVFPMSSRGSIPSKEHISRIILHIQEEIEAVHMDARLTLLVLQEISKVLLNLVRMFIKECWWKYGCSKQCGNRMGTPALTSRGSVEEDFVKVAKFFDAAMKLAVKLKADSKGTKLKDFAATMKKWFRKVGNRSNKFHPDVRRVRRAGSYLYEEFMPTGVTDVKVYTAGPEYAHAEARKSSVVDGVVLRNHDGEEVRYPVSLTPNATQMARGVYIALSQSVCGFDLLRCEGRSYICDVNGWSFVKNSYKNYVDTACEDFSNIIEAHSCCTIYKGTLSSGVKICVAPTSITTRKEYNTMAIPLPWRDKIGLFSALVGKTKHKDWPNNGCFKEGLWVKNNWELYVTTLDKDDLGLFVVLNSQEVANMVLKALNGAIFGSNKVLTSISHALSGTSSLLMVNKGREAQKAAATLTTLSTLDSAGCSWKEDSTIMSCVSIKPHEVPKFYLGLQSFSVVFFLFLVVDISMALIPWLAAGIQLIASRFEQQDVRSYYQVPCVPSLTFQAGSKISNLHLVNIWKQDSMEDFIKHHEDMVCSKEGELLGTQ